MSGELLGACSFLTGVDFGGGSSSSSSKTSSSRSSSLDSFQGKAINRPNIATRKNNDAVTVGRRASNVIDTVELELNFA